jgi:copper chaperone CopZ
MPRHFRSATAPAQYHEVKKGRFIMKKTFKLIDLDCANCAAKMETAIKKLPGVTGATVSFLTQKMTIEADDVDALMKDVVKCCKKVEPDCEIVL